MRVRHVLVALLAAGLTVSSAPPLRATEAAPTRSATAVHAAPGAPLLLAAPARPRISVNAPGPAGSKRGTGKRAVALTFDDGPDPVYTPKLLDVLKAHRVKATFCVLGDKVAQHPRTARRIRAEGHRLCNHTRNHPDMAKLSSSAARKQVLDTQWRVRKVTGVTPTTFRFPYGSSNSRVRAVVQSCQLRTLGWDVDTRDWERPSAGTITNRIVRNVRPGSVVLMHDGGGNRTTTVAALDSTIRQLKKKGYTFVLA